MQLEGKIFQGHLLIQNQMVRFDLENDKKFSENLEKSFIELCRTMEIPVPIWMKKNTKEFAQFHQTFFFQGQFTQRVKFDQFQIRWIEED